MISVVVCFVLATVFSESIESAIARRADDIVGNAMPSVEMLSLARGDLRGLENELERYVSAAPASRAAMRDDIRARRRGLEESLATYASLPFFPTERELYAHIDEDRRAVDRSIDRLLAAPDDDALAEIHRQTDQIDSTLQRVITFDAAQGQRLGLQIEQVHGRAAVLAAFIDALSVMLAVIASVLALRQLRRAARTRAAERAARDLREHELAEQNRALGHFAGRVAHDVLSPLGAVQLSYDILRRAGPAEPRATRAIDRGESALRRVQRLVDGLLAFSRAGGHPEPGASTEVAPAIADVMAELGAQARQARIELTVSPIPDGAVACSDGVLISIISNLVRNAIKYMNGEDRRRIELRVGRVGSTGAGWRFEVEDTGPGIPAEQQQRVFEPYVQLARGGEGIGLGLATVERLARAHGGAVGLTSPPDGGALFWVELPAAEVRSGPGARSSRPAASPA